MTDILHGDCLALMAQLPAGSVDMVLCDLPYGVTDCHWDKIIPFDKLWAQYRRIIRPDGAIVLTATQPFNASLVMSNPKWFRCEWIWVKNRSTGFLHAKHQPLRRHESVLVFGRKAPRYFPQGLREVNTARHTHLGETRPGRIVKPIRPRAYVQKHTGYPTTILEYSLPQPGKGLHPTQKPVELMEYLIKTYTLPGETVLDNCMGSGTTGVACINTGRRFIGMEADPEIYAIARNRILSTITLNTNAHPRHPQ